MAKLRVYQLAKELGIDNAKLLEELKAFGVDPGNHMGSITEAEAELVRSEYSQRQQVKVDEVRIRPNIIRRRKKVEEPPPPVEKKEPAPEEPLTAEAGVAEPDAGPEDEALAEPCMEIPAAADSQEVVSAVEGPVSEAAAGEISKAEEAVSQPVEEVVATRPAAEGVAPGTVAEGTAIPVPTGEGARGKPSGRAKQEKPVLGLPPVVEKKKVAELLKKEAEEEAGRPGKRGRAHAPGKKVVEYSKGRRGRNTEWRNGAPGGGAVRAGKAGDGRRDKRTAVKRPAMKPVITTPKQIKRKVRMGETVTVGDLAKRLSIKASEIIKKLMQNGMMVNINQAIDKETATLIASEYNYEIESVQQTEAVLLQSGTDSPESLQERPPVVTIMGHVNHGKTRLLDTIRESRVMEQEAGGITQHIGAYTVAVGDRNITFLDTPGHEAFTKMRARGATVTDIVILVVAADDGVMPQTVEAINHAKAAKVPIIVAINKIDLPDANPDKVKQGLSEHGLLSEDWGGDTLFAELSAKEKVGIQELLEIVLLQAEMLELRGNPDRNATGIIIEARLDRTLGPVATVLVGNGTLKVGDPFVSGTRYGRVRALIDSRNMRVESAGPSIPVEVLGGVGVPEAGDPFDVLDDEKKAKAISAMRTEKFRQSEMTSQTKMSLDDLYEKIRQEEIKELNVILKADVQGSSEALGEALTKLSNEEVKVKVLHGGVGGVTETDVMLASASNAIIIGFNVRSEPKARVLMEQEKVDVRFYSVIYDAVSDMEAALRGMLKPVYRELVMGHAEVRETFSVSKVGTVAGSYILDGKMERNTQVRVLRDSIVIHEGKLASLRRFKDDVKEVQAGYECGIRMETFNDVKVGDVLESFTMEQVMHPAESSAQGS